MSTQPQPTQRRVRHDVADGAAVMAFSLGVSVGLAVVVTGVLSVIGGAW